MMSMFANTVSRQTRENNGYCVLDCVFHKTCDGRKVYYVLDLICWKGYPFCHSDAEFRFIWIQQKLEECGYDSNNIQQTEFQISNVPVFPMSRLSEAYCSTQESVQRWGFVVDGVLFYDKQGPYIFGLNPFVLFWKDSVCSPYDLMESFDETGRQHVTLEVAHGAAQTLEGWKLTSESNLEVEHRLKLGKFSLESLEVELDQEGQVTEVRVEGVEFIGDASKSRVLSDHLSKIMFNDNVRRGKSVSWEEITEASNGMIE